MLKIRKNDNIFDIISKIKNEPIETKVIVLEFPFWHNILYNKIALKSIKDSCIDKKIVIISSDILSKKIWQQLWIKYSIIKESRINSEKDLLKYNYTFLEYFLYEIKNILLKFTNIFLKSKKNIDPRKHILKYYKQKTHLPIFVAILIISIIIFFYVFFFVLNKTYVYITPNIQVKTKAQNFIFMENSFPDLQNNNINIKLKSFKKEIILEKNIDTTWINLIEKYRSKWKVEIYNNYEEEIQLKSNTRLESKWWIIYEILSWITIPAAVKNNKWVLVPWVKSVNIIASLRDKNWNAIWKNANIDKVGIKLNIPWLDKEDRKNIFAKTSTKITWGEDKYEEILWENDLENAKKLFIENLKKVAIKQIQEEIENINKETNINYKILEVDNIYKFTNIKVDVPNIKVWEKIKNFKIKWNISIQTYAFNIDSVTSKLKNSIDQTLLPEKEKLLYINNKSINIEPKIGIIYRQENPLNIKATVQMEYNVEYNFSSENNNYINRLKQTILWMNKKDAEKKLINENLISNTIIEIRPFFINNVSKYINNIEFIVKD